MRKDYVTWFRSQTYIVTGNRPHSTHQYSNTAPRFEGQTYIFVFFVSCTLLGIEGQKWHKIGHFWVTLYFCLKTSLRLICMKNKNVGWIHLHMNGLASSLVLTEAKGISEMAWCNLRLIHTRSTSIHWVALCKSLLHVMVHTRERFEVCSICPGISLSNI